MESPNALDSPKQLRVLCLASRILDYAGHRNPQVANWNGYQCLSRLSAIAKKRQKYGRQCPGADAPAPRDLAPRGTEDLQNTLKIIKTAISRDEFDFALEVSG